MHKDLVTVTLHNDNTLKTVDINTGAIKVIRQVGGKIIQGPVVTGDKVTITIEEPTAKFGKVYSLPNLILIRTFPIS